MTAAKRKIYVFTRCEYTKKSHKEPPRDFFLSSCCWFGECLCASACACERHNANTATSTSHKNTYSTHVDRTETDNGKAKTIAQLCPLNIQKHLLPAMQYVQLCTEIRSE